MSRSGSLMVDGWYLNLQDIWQKLMSVSVSFIVIVLGHVTVASGKSCKWSLTSVSLLIPQINLEHPLEHINCPFMGSIYYQRLHFHKSESSQHNPKSILISTVQHQVQLWCISPCLSSALRNGSGVSHHASVHPLQLECVSSCFIHRNGVTSCVETSGGSPLHFHFPTFSPFWLSGFRSSAQRASGHLPLLLLVFSSSTLSNHGFLTCGYLQVPAFTSLIWLHCSTREPLNVPSFRDIPSQSSALLFL